MHLGYCSRNIQAKQILWPLLARHKSMKISTKWLLARLPKQGNYIVLMYIFSQSEITLLLRKNTCAFIQLDIYITGITVVQKVCSTESLLQYVKKMKAMGI
jgi:hypothetical protein